MKRLIVAIPVVAMFFVLPALAIPPVPAAARPAVPKPVVAHAPAGMFVSVSGKVTVASPGDAMHRPSLRPAVSLGQFYVGDRIQVPGATAPAEIVFFATGRRWRLPGGGTTRIVSAKQLTAVGAVKPVAMRSITGPLLGAFLLAPGQARFAPNQGGTNKRMFARSSYSSISCVPIGAVRSPDTALVLRWKDAATGVTSPGTLAPAMKVWEGGTGTPPETPPDIPAGNALVSASVTPIPPSTGSEYAVKSVPLEPGKWYAWSVAIGDRTATSTFRLLSGLERSMVTDVEKHFRDVEATSKPDEMTGLWLLLGDFYTRHDLYPDALTAYNAAHALSPDDATAAECAAKLREMLMEPAATTPPPAPVP